MLAVQEFLCVRISKHIRVLYKNEKITQACIYILIEDAMSAR